MAFHALGDVRCNRPIDDRLEVGSFAAIDRGLLHHSCCLADKPPILATVDATTAHREECSVVIHHHMDDTVANFE